MGSAVTGFVGPIPARAGAVDAGLDAGVLTRLDRWWELARAATGPVPAADPRRPAWRLIVAAGVFAAGPVAGVLRLGRDRLGRTGPFLLMRGGEPPVPCDPWFAAAEAVAREATDGLLGLGGLAAAAAALPTPRATAPPDTAALLWRDDWEVHELRLERAADLARFPVAALGWDGGEEAAA